MFGLRHIASVGFSTSNHDLRYSNSWSSGNAFVYGANGLGFKSRAGQSDTVLQMARYRYNTSSKEAVVQWRRDDPSKLVTLFGVTRLIRFDLTIDKI